MGNPRRGAPFFDDERKKQMNIDAMRGMTADELAEYAKALGFSVPPSTGAEERLDLIVSRRARTAKVRALGMDLEVKVKALRDKRVTDLMAKPSAKFTDEDAEQFMRMVLGEDQYRRVVAAATEDDGTVDVDALGIVFAKLFTSKELKNF